MSGDYCNQCKCHYTHHFHWKTMWVLKDLEYDVIDKNQEKLIENAKKDRNGKEESLRSVKASLAECEKRMSELKEKNKRCDF